MAITLGTNIASYTTRMQLNKVSDSLSDTYKKLSTGRKINSASDDSAGLVISQNMQAKIDGSKQAMQNIQTAQSFLTITDNGMASISDHFQRINNLLTNMANDTNDVDSRTAEIREVIERLAEIDRLAESTNFNGMSMLDGSTKNIVVQMGPGYDKATSSLDISIALSDCHVSAYEAELPGVLNPDAVINNYKVGAEDNTNDILSPITFDDGEYTILERTTGTEKAYSLLKKDSNGDLVYATPDESGEYTKYVPDAEKDKLIEVTKGYMVEDSSKGGKISYIAYNSADEKYYNIGADGTYGVGTNMESAFDPTNENCRKYMETVQGVIAKIATKRGLLGAYENRMESSYDSLTTTIESLESAKVPYTDTDIAEEATNLARNQIMQQIGVAVMANSNTSQQLALSLIG